MEDRIGGLRLEEFAGHEGRLYELPVDGGEATLRLEQVQELSSSGREGGSFRLTFIGPSEPRLPQAIYRFDGPDGSDDIFIVPIAMTPEGIRYEAIFY